MKLYTIGYAGKSAREFFTLLKNSDVKKVIDVRLYPSTKDCGFARSKDLEFFLWVLCRIKYEHHKEFAPIPSMLKGYKDNLFGWNDIEEQYLNICKARKFNLTPDMDCACFLCAEPTAEQCHRRLLVEYLARQNPDVEIIHL